MTDRTLRTAAQHVGARLETLALANNPGISDHGLTDMLKACRGITSLDLAGCDIGTSVFKSIGDNLDPAVLDFSGCRKPLSITGVG